MTAKRTTATFRATEFLPAVQVPTGSAPDGAAGLLLRLANRPTIVMSAGGSVVDLNRPAADLMALPVEDAIGGFLPESFPQLSVWLKELRAALSGPNRHGPWKATMQRSDKACSAAFTAHPVLWQGNWAFLLVAEEGDVPPPPPPPPPAVEEAPEQASLPKGTYEWIRAVFDTPMQLAAILDASGNILDVNRTGLDFAGVDLDSVRDLPFWEGPWWDIDEATRAEVRAVVATALTGRQVRCRMDNLESSSRVVCLDFSLRPIMDAVGQVHLLVCEGRDITESVRTEKENRRNTQRLELIAQLTRSVLGRQPLPRQARRVAEMACRAFGVDACVIRLTEGPTLRMLAACGPNVESLPETIPAGLGVAAKVLERCAPYTLTNIMSEPEIARLDNRPGTQFHFVSVAAAPLLADSKALGSIAIFTCEEALEFSSCDLEHLQLVANQLAVAIEDDRLYWEAEGQRRQLEREVKERERAQAARRDMESRFRQLFLSEILGIFFWSFKGGVTAANPRFLRMLGYTEEDLEQGHIDWIKMTPPEHRHGDLLAVQELLTGTPNVTLRKEYIRKDGSRLPVVVGGTLLGNSREEGVGFVLDHSDLRALEQEREQLLARLQLVLGRMPIACVLYDADFHFTFWNDSAERMFGHTSADVLGQHPFELIVPPEGREAVEEAFGRIRAGDMNAQGVTEHIRADGRRIACEWKNTPLLGPDGAFLGAISMAEDITVRLRAEQALRESEERFRHLVEQAADAIFVHSLEGRLTDVNQHACEHLGYSREELLERSFWDIEPNYSRTQVVNLWSQLEPGHPVTLSCTFRRRDGSEFPAELRVGLMESGGQRRVLALSRDVTERRLAEVEIRSRARQQSAVARLSQKALLSREMPELFDEAVRELVETLGIDCAIMCLGDSSESDLRTVAGCGWLGEEYRNVSIPRQEDSLLAYTMRANQPVIAQDFEHETRFRLTPHMTAQGVVSAASIPIPGMPSPHGVIGVFARHTRTITGRDLSFLQSLANVVAAAIERANAEETVRRLNAELEDRVLLRTRQLETATLEAQQAGEEAERANRAKSEFLSRMSHELRTPLNAILGFAQLLELSPGDSDQRTSTGHILKAGKHLLGLINEVLDISRIESGSISVSLAPVAVADVLRQSIDLVAPAMVARGIALRWDEQAMAGVAVLADAGRLKQVLINVLSNAVKYNRFNGTISIHHETTPDGFFRVVVADTGVGIPRSRIHRLFTPFDRLGAEQTGVEGAGLGLALSRRLMEIMSARLSLESSEGEGTRVFLDLRLGTGQVVAKAPPLLKANPVELDPADAPVVLHVEDNQSNIELVDRILVHQLHCRVLTATTLAQASEILLRNTPDLILLDLHLPDGKGFSLLTTVRASSLLGAIPVIVVSADASPSQKDRALASGADDYLSKPLDIALLLETIRKVLAKKAKRG